MQGLLPITIAHRISNVIQVTEQLQIISYLRQNLGITFALKVRDKSI